MRLVISGSAGDLLQAIDDFKENYHADYFGVRDRSSVFLDSIPERGLAEELSVLLVAGLGNWGAGRRGAPLCRAPNDVADALCNRSLHRDLCKLSHIFKYMALRSGRRVLRDGAPFANVAEFDACLINVLKRLADALFVGNTNVTYPMKALLMLTGLMPAYDSQVRGGLSVAGFSGVKKTRYLMPNVGAADARKICVLPFYMADCVENNIELLSSVVARSNYKNLIGQYGRMFDVFLFMQGSGLASCLSFVFENEQKKWFDV